MVFFKLKKKKKNFVVHSTVDFQITLSTYKLNSQNKKIIYIYKYIYKIKTQIFFKLIKKKHHRMREARVMRLVSYNVFVRSVYRIFLLKLEGLRLSKPIVGA